MLLRGALASGLPPALRATCSSAGLDVDSSALTPGAAVDVLERLRRSSAADGNACGVPAAELEAALEPLTLAYLRGGSVLDTPTELTPAAWDMVAADVHEPDLANVHRSLGIRRFAPVEAEGDLSAPIAGTFYGCGHRLFLPLTVASARATLHVAFLVDTGAPATFLCPETLAALGYPGGASDTAPVQVRVRVQGLPMSVFRSRGGFRHVDVLGQDFLRAAWVALAVDYKELTVTLTAQR